MFKTGDKVVVIERSGASEDIGTKGVVLRTNTGLEKDKVEIRYEKQNTNSSFPYQTPSSFRLLTPLDELL